MACSVGPPSDRKPATVGRDPDGAPWARSGEGAISGLRLVAHLTIPNEAEEVVSDVWKLGTTVLVGYRCGGGGSALVDVADPAAPRLLARTPGLPTLFANDVKAIHLDTAAYSGDVFIEPHDNCGATATPARTRLWDIGDPAHPRILSELTTYSGVHNAYPFARGERAYLLMALPRGDTSSRGVRGGFGIADITDPRRPRVVGVYNLRADLGDLPGTDFLHDVWADSAGEVAYLSWWDAGLVLLDISDVSAPRLLSRLDYYRRPEVTGRAEGNTHATVLGQGGRYAFVSDEDFSLASFDLRLRGSEWGAKYPVRGYVEPALLGGVDPGTVPLARVAASCGPGAQVAGRIAVTRLARGCSAVDQARRLEAAGARAVVFVGTDPTQVAAAGVRIPVMVLGDAAARGLAGAAAAGVPAAMEARVDSWGFTRVVDLQAPGGPSLVAVITTTNTTRFPPPDRGWYSVHNPFVAGNTLYLSHYSDGVRAVDVTDPARPVERGYFVPPDLPDRRGRPLKTLVWGVYADDGLVYASDISHGLWILADPGAEAGATATTAAAPVPRTPSPPPTALPAPPPTASAPPTPTASQPPPARATATVPLPPSATPPAAGATTATVAAAPGTATVTAAHVATDAPTAVATPLPPAATSTAAGGRLEDGLHTAWLPILVTRRPSVPGDGGAQGGDHTGSQGTGLVPATEKSPGAHLGGGALEVGQGQEVVLAGSWVFDSVSVRSGGLLRGEKYAGPGSSGGTLELVADRIVVETGGHLSVDAAGFRGVVEGTGEGPGGGEGGTVTLAARRPSAGSPFPWLGAPTAVLAGPQHFTGAGAGGAYGGRGGDGMSFGARGEWQGGRAYGQAEGATVQWGSAGGAAPKSHHETASIPGGSGAGALVLRASFLRIDGSVSADGEAGPHAEYDAGGGGAGGGILIDAQALIVKGTISASGGPGGEGWEIGGAGGGGRVKVTFRRGVAPPGRFRVEPGRGPCPGDRASPYGCPGTVSITRLADPSAIYLPLAAAHGCVTATPLALVVAVDVSRSMATPRDGDLPLDDAVAAADALLASLRGADRGGVVTFAGTAQTLSLLASPASARAALARIVAGAGSRLDLGIRAAAVALSSAPPGAQRQMVLLTDGAVAGASWGQVVAAAARASEAGIQLYALGFGGAVDEARLKALATEPGGVLVAPTEGDLATFARRLRSAVPCGGGR